MLNELELLGDASGRSRKNYEFNRRRKQPERLINGQGNCIVSQCKFGMGKVSMCGCGAIAVYNALLCTGQRESFPLIVLGLENYALRMGGLLGTDPKKIDKFFSECKIPAMKAENFVDFVNVMSAVKVGIVCYWTAKPYFSLLHFAAVVNNGDGSYAVCNRYTNRKTPAAVKKIESLCTEDRYVCGFFMR
ncbi:MAG: hypothetical protein NC078_01290 [Ruminococcus sp.]|nr:hypothetical protein [Ruminococcus sp.]